MSSESSSSIVGDLLDYLNESWTQFHATAEAKRQLIAAGFHLLNENEEWDLKPGGRYFFTRNMSSLVAFAIGKKYSIGNGFHIIAAHTDSPCMKLKPRSASCKSGYLMVNVQIYGGGLWHTWFDRDLTVAGRVILRAKDGSFLHRLVKVKRPLLRVPTLAIHLNRSVVLCEGLTFILLYCNLWEIVFTSRKFNRSLAIVIFYYLFFGTFPRTAPSLFAYFSPVGI